MTIATTASTRLFRLRIRDALAPFPAKVLARWAGGLSERTAEHWRAGRTVPNGDALLALMRSNDEIMARLLGRPIE